MALSISGSKVERRKDVDFYPEGCSDEEKVGAAFSMAKRKEQQN